MLKFLDNNILYRLSFILSTLQLDSSQRKDNLRSQIHKQDITLRLLRLRFRKPIYLALFMMNLNEGQIFDCCYYFVLRVKILKTSKECRKELRDK